MELEQLEIQETAQLDNLYNSNAVKFNKLKHTYFKDFLKKSDTYIDFLKLGSKHYAFQLPENIGEFFLKKENAPFFWLLESPLLYASEKLLNENSNGHKDPYRNEIKKNFTKWIIAVAPGQKKIFASMTLRDIKSSAYSSTFIDLIYYALILIFEESLRNPNKALVELTKAKNIVDESVNEPGLKKELSYLIQLYKGFAFFVIGNNEEASKELSYAIDSKTHGITAKFYFSYLSAIQNREEFTKALIKEILDYDLERLKYAIDNCSIVLLNFFIHNPVFPNIFHYYEFSPYSEYIQTELIENQLDTKKVVANLNSRLNQLKKCEFDGYFSDEMKLSNKVFV